MQLTEIPGLTTSTKPLRRSARDTAGFLQTSDGPPGSAFKQHLVGAVLLAFAYWAT